MLRDLPRSSEKRPSLRPRELRAIEALAAGSTVKAAAEAAGVTPRTVRAWRARPAFALAEREATAELHSATMRVLSGGMPEAASYLVDAARGEAEIDHGRINAARLVLDLGRRFRDALEIEERIAALEELHAARETWRAA